MTARLARRRRGSAVLLAAIWCSGFTTAVAADPTPRPPSDPWTELPAATLAGQAVSALKLGPIKVWLEFNTLSDVVKVAGENRLSHYEDDDVAYDWLCYDADAHLQRLWFISDSDSGGVQRMVTSIAAAVIDAADASRCPLLPKVLGTMALDRAIWLGTKDSDLVQKLGEPSSSMNDWLSFYANHRMLAPRDTPNSEGAMDDDVAESSYLNVRLLDGRVVQLIAGKLTGG